MDIRERIEKLIGPRPSSTYHDTHWVQWHEQLINRLAKSARIRYGYEHKDGWFLKRENDHTTSAIMLDFQPIKRGVTKAEIIKELRERNGIDFGLSVPLKDLADRIESEGIIND
jgi:hypothetical protein